MALTELSMALWLIFFCFSVGFGILMIRKALGPDLERPQREYYIGMAIFIFVHLVARIFYFYYDFIDINEFYWDLGAIIGLLGIVFVLYAIERNIFTRSKFLFTITTLIFILMLIILPPYIKPYLQTIIVSIIGIFLPLIYVYVGIKSHGNIRKNSLLIAVGILIFLIGQTAHSATFFTTAVFIYFIISPICIIIGGFIFFYGLIRPS
ncbi:MAG TPA: hypothetical protein VMV49_06210 [Candidatus Deferrimicrobium sp.]|nr:hypothetical protein [Candidatus Deferrimicrobium sp.]